MFTLTLVVALSVGQVRNLYIDRLEVNQARNVAVLYVKTPSNRWQLSVEQKRDTGVDMPVIYVTGRESGAGLSRTTTNRIEFNFSRGPVAIDVGYGVRYSPNPLTRKLGRYLILTPRK